MNSFQKGCRAEREWRDVLNAAGYTARRGRQFAGGPETPDVVCDELRSIVHFEIKHSQRPNPFAFMAQAVRDAGGKRIPVVAMRRNGSSFLCVIPAADFISLIQSCDLEALARRAGTISPENERARAVGTNAGSSPELVSSIPTAGELQGTRDPHFTMTVQFMRLHEHEKREFLEDVHHGYPALWQIVSEGFEGGKKP